MSGDTLRHAHNVDKLVVLVDTLVENIVLVSAPRWTSPRASGGVVFYGVAHAS